MLLVLAPWIAESELREHSRTPSQLLGSGVHCVENHRPEKIVAHTPSLNRGITEMKISNKKHLRVGSYGPLRGTILYPISQKVPESWVVCSTAGGSQSPAVVVPAHRGPVQGILYPGSCHNTPNNTNSSSSFLLRYSGPPGGAVNPGPRILGRSVSKVTELNLTNDQ